MNWQEKYGDYACRCWAGHFALARCDEPETFLTVRGAKEREYYDPTHETPCTQLRDPGPLPGSTSHGWPLVIGSKRLDGFFANLIAHRKRWVACRVCHSYMRSWNASSCRTTAMWDVSPKRTCAQPGEFHRFDPWARFCCTGRWSGAPHVWPWEPHHDLPCSQDETLLYWEYGRSTVSRCSRGAYCPSESVTSVSCGNPCGPRPSGYGRHATLAG